LDVAIDETGTVAAPLMEDDIERSRIAEQEVSKEIEGVSEYLLEVHGLPPGRKGEGVTRVIYENLNGLQSTLSKNEKLDKARQVIDDLQADVVCYNEHRQNLKHKTNRNGFRQMFNGGETNLRAIAAHNANKEAGKFQEGGTAMLVYGDLIEQFDLEGSGQDDLGLERWTFMKFKGGDGVVTRVICGYSPCSNKKKDSGTVYQQHRRHLINNLNDLTCPRVRFRDDLLRHMKQWRAAGERLVLCLDANENIYRAELGQQLTDLHGLGMREVVGDFTGKRLGATFFRGSEPIDAIWATSDLEVAHACVMPVGYGVGNHLLLTSLWRP
jgi:exonuclease III